MLLFIILTAVAVILAMYAYNRWLAKPCGCKE